MKNHTLEDFRRAVADARTVNLTTVFAYEDAYNVYMTNPSFYNRRNGPKWFLENDGVWWVCL